MTWRSQVVGLAAMLLAAMSAAALYAESHVKVIKLAITNPGAQARTAEDIVVPTCWKRC
ncbi:MAG: hypothetical protein ABSH49_27525 [Bryobacteraceae bacterium]|jgi:hypothetical protein